MRRMPVAVVKWVTSWPHLGTRVSKDCTDPVDCFCCNHVFLIVNLQQNLFESSNIINGV